MTITGTAGYALATGDTERTRLLAQCEIHRGEAGRLLDRFPITGGRVLDVGCGPLGVLDLLAERAGPTCTVVGLDREARFLVMAAESLGGAHPTPELVAGDATATGLPADSFDLVHERTVLNNVPDPGAVVAEMARVTRPGGYVVLQDMDWVSWTCQPAHPAWGLLATAAAQAWAGNVYVGRRLPDLLRRSGLVDVEVDAHVRTWRTGDPCQSLLLRFAESYRDRILDDGLLTEAEFDACVRGLTAHLAHPNTFTLYATLFQAWGRKP
jgi:SAM-dependent methyltransferase